MARRRAKIVIVEGPSDNTALSVYLSRYFDEKNIEFIELHSNILSERYKKPNNIITDLNNIIDVTKFDYTLFKREINKLQKRILKEYDQVINFENNKI